MVSRRTPARSCYISSRVGCPMARTRVLCIDDYEPALQSIRLVLQAVGYEVVTAADAAAADAIEDGAWDAAVIDYHLPDSDGYAVARKLKQRNPVPVVMLSGEPVDIPPQAMEAVDAFVVKGPNTAQEITSAVAALIAYGPEAFRQKKFRDLRQAAAGALKLDPGAVGRWESER